jgi:aminoglycoside phosphotransferase family enzyme/predicted kinase
MTASDASDTIVRDLARAGAYPPPRPPAVGVRTTHASWVFLAGDAAWKVKRPVALGFLDFRKAEARRRACEDEVRLNRRLAPEVYQGVVPIHLGPAGHAFHGGGPVVDWAVRMRRLPDEASAAALLRAGRLTSERLAALAARLAAFFADARVTPDFGRPSALRFNVDENFVQVEPYVGAGAAALVDRATFEDIRRFQQAELVSREAHFAERVSAGRIREGHGDLRLEHVYFLPEAGGAERVTVIDCIEFNERFRCGDIAAEVAFLAMELEAAGRPDLAAGFLARFAEASGDFRLYSVLDFYLSYRAFVRGKVAAFLAGDAAADPALRRSKHDEARRCFALSRAFSGAPVDPPFVIAVGGMIGSGKSTLAEALGRELAAPVVDSDRMRKRLAGLAPTDRGDATLYSDGRTEATYAALLEQAAAVVRARRGVILDATFRSRKHRAAAAAMAEAAGARFVLLETRCADRRILQERLRRRAAGPAVSDARENLLEAFEKSYEPVASSERGVHVVVDTSAPWSGPTPVEMALRGLSPVGITTARERVVS